MMRTIRLTLLTTAALVLLSTAAFAIFTNGGFEAGDFSGGWLKASFINPGLTGAPPFSGSNIVRNAGGSDRTAVVGPAATPLSLTDPIVAAVQYPRFGTYAGRVNYWPTASNPNQVANSLRQQSIVGAGDIDASDGKVHARFVYLPVLEDGSHIPTQQAYFYIAVRNVTKGTVVWERFAFANEAGVPWSSSGLYRYTAWQAVDASGGPGVIDVGDTLELEVVASSCALGGHRGHVYVDAFGSTIPGGSIVATAPSSTVPNASLTYNMHVANGGTSTLAAPVVSITVPAQTAFVSVTNPACSLAAGVVTCNLPDLAAGGTVDFDLVVSVSGAATGTITLGDYSISGTGYPALLGPARTTVVNAPVAMSDSYTTTQNTALVVAAPGVLVNDTDPNGDALTAVLATNPAHGTLTLNADGSFTYTPTGGYTGPDSFIYRARDASNNLSTATNVALSVTLPGTPVAVADAYSTNEDTPLAVSAAGVLANDTDSNADPLTAVLVTGPSRGTLTLNADGSFLYTPAANYHGTDAFSYRATDGTLSSSVVAVSLTIATVNDPPAGAGDGGGGTFTIGEEGTLTVPGPGVLGNDTDADGDPITAILVTGPAHGTLTLNPNGGFVYTPFANYSGPDSFVYHATDGTSESADTTVVLSVTNVNDAPTATADGGGSYSVSEDGALSVPAPGGVLANDGDVDGDPLTAILVSGPSHGTLTLNPDGSFVYTPTANYNGPDSFVYRASDGTLQSGATTVTLNVTAVADPPTAGNDGVGGTFATNEDGTLTVPAPGVLGNDVDPDGDPLTASLVNGPAHGTLTFNADGSFVYTPDANYAGSDSFTYTVSDGTHTSAPATVTLTVNPVNDPPTAVANTYALGEDHTLSVPASSGLLTNDSDVDPSTTLTALLVTGPAHGTLTLHPDGSFTYVPDANFNGVDTFTYQVSDGTATSAPVTVTLNVGDDVSVEPGSGRDTGGTRVTVDGTGFGPAGTPVTVTVGGVPALDAEVLDDGHITFVTPPLPPGASVDIVIVVNNGTPETLPGAFLPLPVPAAGDPADTDGDGITDEIELKYGLDPTNPGDAGDDPDHDGVPSNTEIIQGTHPNAPYLRYFAEGINNRAFNTGIAVANASTATNEVVISFFRQGQAPVRKNLTLRGRTRVMLNTATVPGMADAAFGVEIAGNEAVTADRTTFWDLGGREAHSEHAVESSPTWYFAEGATTGRFSLFYLLTNPGSQAANVTVTFLRQVGTPIVKQVVVPAYARLTIPVNTADPGLASADLGGIVSADRPIVAERSMYLSSETKIWEAGTGGTGVTAPANRWFFGEGATGSFFDAWILLSNPGATDAIVDVRYVADSGADVTRSHIVPAGRRVTIRVVDEDPAMMNTSFATFVTSTNAVPVVAERAMWWRAEEGHWTAGHVGVGFTAGGKKWVTADGVAAADGSSDTYALVSNTENRSGLLKVMAVFDDGTAPVERTFAIGPNKRFTIRGRDRFPEVVGKGYSFIIESIGAAPVDVVVDHSTYFNVDGRFWAMGTTSPGSKIR
jgi:VCBS repeat-containing protein